MAGLCYAFGATGGMLDATSYGETTTDEGTHA